MSVKAKKNHSLDQKPLNLAQTLHYNLNYIIIKDKEYKYDIENEKIQNYATDACFPLAGNELL